MSTWSSPATARCSACRGSPKSPGIWRSSTKRRPSRTRTPNRPAPSRSSRRARDWRSPARRSRTGLAICGPSSTSSTRDCWDRRRSSRASPSASAERAHNSYGPLRELVRPYILRRLKTDKAVIADLPDKTEIKAFCPLSRKQAALYEQAVKELAEQLDEADGIRRKGLVLAFLMRFKQICNHPSQWLGDGAWREADSGKWARLRDIAEVIAARQEKMLVFTQFREVTAPLAAFLGSVFGRPGLVLHGETEVKKRKDLVRRFQEDESVRLLRAFAQGRRLGPQPHRRIARGALRPLVEPGGREPGHRPRLPHRPDQKRARAQVRLPRYRGGEDRPAHRVQAPALARSCWRAAPTCC